MFEVEATDARRRRWRGGGNRSPAGAASQKMKSELQIGGARKKLPYLLEFWTDYLFFF